ncbi:LLM class flavin-dependent oxidoreductase [Rathayibacter toxicus]|uniref:LLM class flavin-dependent oxidoreductase n=1 Tax=Rathayibacter toxicus TaxID=145458 RepID=A0A0U1PU75_9MICO|nr:LLM class flavin-dependent oxidoreductase [Rathayibacter toxicus]ALS56962.1 hypothetical protein APU90_03595 [Rathayibacter toxicus]KKM46206.1 hypothetical protein VT73_03900 [Rathayibacter toxicus]PPG23164.1 LLM class flavin-dependent oxidoreductase [Rathayibacter toxicus]PPG47747.1 LLM class flavin-dependent oxidoreductase [Rathayibacter toxicus]PPH24890.1 LLM class flavin-dependent oxidoreductase [Rathayibacter toxicus]
MSRDLRFNWYAPTHGDGRLIGGHDAELTWSPQYVNRVALRAEEAGCDGILLPVGPTCADAIVTAAHIALSTERLRVIVALRTGAILPTIAAKSLATLSHVAPHRIAANIVTGASPMELAMDGDALPHADRYERTSEFIHVLRRSWTHESCDYAGKFFTVSNAHFAPTPISTIPVYLGGASDAAVTTAARYADTYLMWGEPAAAVAQQCERVRLCAEMEGRQIRCGLRINLIVDTTRERAWSRAHSGLQAVSHKQRVSAAEYIRDSDSEGLRRIQETQTAPIDEHSPYWTGMVPFRSGNSTALVGSPEEVSDALAQYVTAGVDEFIFSSYPHDETSELVGKEVLPRLRSQFPSYLPDWSGR